MKNLIKEISAKLKSKFLFDFDTSNNVWFRAGGKADIFCYVYDENELQYILSKIQNLPYEVIGAGSNILIRDNGFKGIIFKLGKDFNKIILNQNTIEVGASILDINLSKFAEINNIKNFEFYSGIPGSIGGAIKMNAGCYGSETKDILKNVKVINSNGDFLILDKDQINLSYRKSQLSKNNIIISANYNISHGEKDEIKEKINQIKIMRENSQPLKTKTSGSTFKNPKNYFAAKLIENSGCKGLNIGDVFVSEKHANFLINKNKATASQIEDLGKKIIDRVYKKFDIVLDWEIKIIGD